MVRDADLDPEHRRRFDVPDTFVPSLEHALHVIARWKADWLACTRYAFAVRDAVTGTLVGGVELQPSSAETANVSYWTYPEHRDRGYASRAVALACDVAFSELSLKRLEISTDLDNVASRTVATRNGFNEIGLREGRLLHVREV